jgi:hypothetical protein
MKRSEATLARQGWFSDLPGNAIRSDRERQRREGAARMNRLALALVSLALTGCPETAPACEDPNEVLGPDGCVLDPFDAGGDAGEGDAGPQVDAGPCGVCEATRPVCAAMGDDYACVECDDDTDCDEGVCDETIFECTGCVDDVDCDDPSASHCDGGTCVPCNDNSEECAHIEDRHACYEGTCVGCTVDSESTHCGTTACDPIALECTNTPRGTLGTCAECLADSECRNGGRCVPVMYMGGMEGFYCLPPAPGGGCVVNEAPFRRALTGRVSRSEAAAATYCGINEALTTCGAVLAALGGAGAGCEIGNDGPCRDGGFCAVTESGNRCSYACDDALQCPNSGDLMGCPTSGDRYCGGGL